MQLCEQIVEAVEPHVPGLLERAHPVVDRLERHAVDAIPAVPSVVADPHQIDRPQHAQVLRHLRLALVEPLDKLADRDLPGPDRVDWYSVIDSWVEQGTAPERVVATKMESGKVTRSRPLCAYPLRAVYKGSGSIDDEANFTCTK